MLITSQFRKRILETSFHKRLLQGTLRLDNSEFTNWDGCFTKGLFAGALKQTSKRSASALVFGGAVHAALEAHLKGEPVNRQLEQANEYAIKNGLPDMHDPRRNMEVLQECIKHYNVDYALRIPQFAPITIDDQLMVESSFLLPMGTVSAYAMCEDGEVRKRNINVMWMGKIDLLTTWERPNDVWLVDHKTTTVMGDKFADDLMRSSQMLGYTWAVRQLLHESGMEDKSVRGVIINAIALRTKGFEFRTLTLPIADWAVDEWRHEVLIRLRDLIEQYTELLVSGTAATTRQHCVTKYGKCPFFEVCQVHPRLREEMLFDSGGFVTSDWSPLD